MLDLNEDDQESTAISITGDRNWVGGEAVKPQVLSQQCFSLS